MFDNGKGHMIRTTDIFRSCGYAGEGFGGGSKFEPPLEEDEQVKQDLEGRE